MRRTRENAEAADITVEVAVDFGTGGERDTKRFAGSRYIAFELSGDAEPWEAGLKAGQAVVERLVEMGMRDVRINMAGNGIYTLEKHGISQEFVDVYCAALAYAVVNDKRVNVVNGRSGGQTGLDEAGVLGFLANGVDCVVLAPKGFKMRVSGGYEGKDVFGDGPFIARFTKERVEHLRSMIRLRAGGETARKVLDSRQNIISDVSKAVTRDVAVQYNGIWTREQVSADTRSLYVFTDNTDRDSGHGVVKRTSDYYRKYGKGGDLHFPTVTAAVIRGLDNAFPVSTQHWYHYGATGEAGRWTDADIDEFRAVIGDEFGAIRDAWDTGRYDRIVFPDGGGLFGGKISAITPERTPLLFAALKAECDSLMEHIGSGLRLDAKYPVVKWARYAADSYECSTRGDRRFSAFVARFAPGTEIYGLQVGGKTIEDVYQHDIKRSGKGLPPKYDSIVYVKGLTKQQQEEITYTVGYLPLWTVWAQQNLDLIADLRQRSQGRTLTDMFASTGVSQARALADILNGNGRQPVRDKDMEIIRSQVREILEGDIEAKVREVEMSVKKGI